MVFIIKKKSNFCYSITDQLVKLLQARCPFVRSSIEEVRTEVTQFASCKRRVGHLHYSTPRIAGEFDFHDIQSVSSVNLPRLLAFPQVRKQVGFVGMVATFNFKYIYLKQMFKWIF